MDVLLEKKDRIATITINREKAHNALNSNVLEALCRIFGDLEKDDEVLVAIITGAGRKAFVAGADVKEIREAGKERAALVKRGQEVLTMIRNTPKVVIAAVNGFALGGGCELAMCCDIRFASESARFGLPEATLGLMPGYGGTQWLSRLVGAGRAKYLTFSGEMLSAAEAFAFGLVDKVCSGEELPGQVETFARKIIKNGPLALKGIKKAINEGLDHPIPQALDIEFEQYVKVAASEDAEAGMTAFMERKPPVFKGR
jgi:enoyl-CoA hydratase